MHVTFELFICLSFIVWCIVGNFRNGRRESIALMDTEQPTMTDSLPKQEGKYIKPNWIAVQYLGASEGLV